MKPYYYIHSPCEGIQVNRKKYNTLESAVEDAESLARYYPGITFEVLQCVALSSSPKPNAKTFYLDRANYESFRRK